MSFTEEKAFELVEAAHRRERLAHALLLTGPSATALERLAARIIRLVSPAGTTGADLWGEPVEEALPPLDDLAGTHTRIVRPTMKSRKIGIDSIRDLEQMIHMAAESGQWKVAVVVEAERMSPEAENTFLKTLEEPPPSTLILMLTTMPESLLPTIRSRCLILPLISTGLEIDDAGRRLIEILHSLGGDAMGNPKGALVLQAEVAGVLAEIRKSCETEAGKAAKAETEHYAKTTESAKWLKHRGEEHDASARSDYLRARHRLFDLLGAWVGDVLRQKAGGSALDFPEESAVTAELASAFEWQDLLHRFEAFEDLRRSLETNAQEQLAMEVGFLRAFG
jgi:DNA polymerase-3 subunit delta'